MTGVEGWAVENRCEYRAYAIRPQWGYTVAEVLALVRAGEAAFVLDQKVVDGPRHGWVKRIGNSTAVAEFELWQSQRQWSLEESLTPPGPKLGEDF